MNEWVPVYAGGTVYKPAELYGSDQVQHIVWSKSVTVWKSKKETLINKFITIGGVVNAFYSSRNFKWHAYRVNTEIQVDHLLLR